MNNHFLSLKIKVKKRKGMSNMGRDLIKELKLICLYFNFGF